MSGSRNDLLSTFLVASNYFKFFFLKKEFNCFQVCGNKKILFSHSNDIPYMFAPVTTYDVQDVQEIGLDHVLSESSKVQCNWPYEDLLWANLCEHIKDRGRHLDSGTICKTVNCRGF